MASEDMRPSVDCGDLTGERSPGKTASYGGARFVPDHFKGERPQYPVRIRNEPNSRAPGKGPNFPGRAVLRMLRPRSGFRPRGNIFRVRSRLIQPFSIAAPVPSFQ